MLAQLPFPWCYGVFRCSISLRVVLVFKDIIYVIIIFYIHDIWLSESIFGRMCGTIDYGSCIRWVLGFGMNPGMTKKSLLTTSPACRLTDLRVPTQFLPPHPIAIEAVGVNPSICWRQATTVYLWCPTLKYGWLVVTRIITGNHYWSYNA
jgi:hypothetical protein